MLIYVKIVSNLYFLLLKLSLDRTSKKPTFNLRAVNLRLLTHDHPPKLNFEPIETPPNIHPNPQKSRTSNLQTRFDPTTTNIIQL